MRLLKELTATSDSLLTEISRAKKTELKKSQALEKRAEALAAKKAEEERLAAILAKRQEKKMQASMTPVQKAPAKNQEAGFLAHPELRKYVVDPTIDTDFEGGYYLKFNTDFDGTTAYWSKGNLSYEQASEFKQVLRLGKRFNASAFSQLLDHLVDASSKGGQPGYVHIEVDKKFLNNPFYSDLYSFLLREYPADEPTVSGTVNWELV